MSLNEFIVEDATLLLSQKLGVSGGLPVESFGHRGSSFNRLNSDCSPRWGYKMSN